MLITDVEDRFDEVTRLVELVAEDEITAKNAKETVLREMLDDDEDRTASSKPRTWARPAATR